MTTKSKRATKPTTEAGEPQRVNRVDRLAMPLAERFDRTPTGGLVLPARIARDGILRYTKADGTIQLEYRPATEAFDSAMLRSIEDAPVTVLHPPKLLTPDTVRRYSVGHAKPGAHRDGNFVATNLAVTDQSAIDRIDAREIGEISMGYTCVVKEQPGTAPNGEKYTHTQSEIRANHIALIPKGTGRAGPDVALRLDALVEALDSDETRIDGDELRRASRASGPIGDVLGVITRAVALAPEMRFDGLETETDVMREAMRVAMKPDDRRPVHTAESIRIDIEARLDSDDVDEQFIAGAFEVSKYWRARVDHLERALAEKSEAKRDQYKPPALPPSRGAGTEFDENGLVGRKLVPSLMQYDPPGKVKR